MRCWHSYPTLCHRDLSRTGLTGIQPGAFAGANQIRELYLYDNDIKSLHMEAFTDNVMALITTLRLDGNPSLTELPYGVLDRFISLKRLSVNDCAIASLHWRFFERCGGGLLDLDMSNNRLTWLDSRTFRFTPALKQLSLVGNPLDLDKLVPEELFEPLHQLLYPWWQTVGPPFDNYVPSSIPSQQDTVRRTGDGTHRGTYVDRRRR